MRVGMVELMLTCGLACAAAAEQERGGATQEAPNMPGEIVGRDPLWISVEGGREPKLHVHMTKKQQEELKQNYQAVFINVVRPARTGFIYGLNGKAGVTETFAFRMKPGHPGLSVEDIIPLKLIGEGEARKKTVLGYTPYAPWETVLERPVRVEFSRDLEEAGAEALEAAPPGWTHKGLRVHWPDGKRPKWAESFEAIEVWLSTAKNPERFKTARIDTWTKSGRLGVGMFGGANITWGSPAVSRNVKITVKAMLGVKKDGTKQNIPLD